MVNPVDFRAFPGFGLQGNWAVDDLLQEFLTETTESMDVLDVELVRLEQNPNDPELLGNIFRLVHTVKGTCGFLVLPRLGSVAHIGENVLGKMRGDWFDKSQSKRIDSRGRKRRLLRVVDSAFFCNFLGPMLNVAGYSVTAVESAAEALAIWEKGEDFDLFISDIEMPDVDNFEFAENPRAGGKWVHKLIIALSSHRAPRDMARGRDAGFTDYEAESDRDGLLQTLQDTFLGDAGHA